MANILKSGLRSEKIVWIYLGFETVTPAVGQAIKQKKPKINKNRSSL